jgi:hypothetical protein
LLQLAAQQRFQANAANFANVNGPAVVDAAGSVASGGALWASAIAKKVHLPGRNFVLYKF